MALLLGAAVHAQTVAPDALVTRLSADLLEAARTDKAVQVGDVKRGASLVNTTVIPHVNMQRMTGLAVGRDWRDATPEQRQRLQSEFTMLLVRTYATALALADDQKIVVI